MPRKQFTKCCVQSSISPPTGFIDAIDHAIADNEVIATLFVETQLRAFFHRARFAANRHPSLLLACVDTLAGLTYKMYCLNLCTSPEPEATEKT